jgi:two-component system response regulator AtoC
VKRELEATPAGGPEPPASGARPLGDAPEAGDWQLDEQGAIRFLVGGRTVLVADPTMLRAFRLVRRLAASGLSLLVVGETGTGKENVAAAVHRWSARAAGPFVTLNCAALPETLIESELFGYQRGAFSDARFPKPGFLERAAGGTIFLDEVGELPAAAQAKLLRALEEKRITRLGDTREREVDIRVVAATHRDLEAECRAGRFREDLLFRLSAAVVFLPPLRQRPREVALLAREFLNEARARAGRPPLELSEAARRRLASYPWPGNVRELKNAMEYAAATVEGAIIQWWDLHPRISGHGPAGDDRESFDEDDAASSELRPVAPPSEPRRFRPIAAELRDVERARILEALEAADGVQTRAAELISMPVRTFALRLKQYGITARVARRRT